METISEKMDDAFLQARSQIEQNLMLKNTEASLALDDQMNALKSRLLDRFEHDLASIPSSSRLSKIDMASQIQNKWDATLKSELELWSKEELIQWAEKAQDIWKGAESLVIEKSKEVIKFLQDHNPLNQQCPVPPQSPSAMARKGSRFDDVLYKRGFFDVVKAAVTLIGKVIGFLVGLNIALAVVGALLMGVAEGANTGTGHLIG
jgi:hypothetical protein